jgi:hypothetical protein
MWKLPLRASMWVGLLDLSMQWMNGRRASQFKFCGHDIAMRKK